MDTVERNNEVVGAALRHYVAADHKDWNEYLPYVEFAINGAYHEAIKATPFSLNRICIPRNPFNVLTGMDEMRSPLAHTMGVSQVRELAGIRTAVQAKAQFDWARQCVQMAKDKMKEVFVKQRLNLLLYAVHDLVSFNIRHVALRHPTARH